MKATKKAAGIYEVEHGGVTYRLTDTKEPGQSIDLGYRWCLGSDELGVGEKFFPTRRAALESLEPRQKFLWSFNWKGTEGFNQVYASTRSEAIAESRKVWPGHEANPATLKRWPKSREHKYYASLPLFD